MRGFPLINLLLVLLLLGGMAVPLIMLSMDQDEGEKPIVSSVQEQSEVRPCKVSVRLVHQAESAQLMVGETVLHAWKFTEPELEFDVKLGLQFVDDGTEFEMQLKYAESVPETVAEITLEPEGHKEQKQNVWGNGETAETLHFSWND